MKLLLRNRLLPAVLLTVVVCSSSNAASVPGVRSVKLTNNEPTYFFINELDMFAGGVDAASTANGATITATDNATTWGSNEGAIDDFVQTGCCDGTYHSDTDGGGAGGQSVNITFDQAYEIDAIDFYGRLDNCCPERSDNFTIEYFSGADASGELIASQDVLGAGTASLAAAGEGGAVSIAVVPEPSSMCLAGMAAVMFGAFARRRKLGRS